MKTSTLKAMKEKTEPKEQADNPQLERYLKEGINYSANTIKNADPEDLKQLASDSFYEGYNVAMKEIEKAFYAGYNQGHGDYTWEQFKKDNNL